MEIFVSFVVPVFNCEKYLMNCIQSLRSVQIPDKEIILIDDGSADASGGICDQAADMDSSIQVIHQKNSGVSTARNEGIRAASGRYLIFIDADDTIDAAKLTEKLSELREEPSIDLMIYGMSFDYYRHGTMYRSDTLSPSLSGILTMDEWSEKLTDLYHTNSLNTCCNKVISRELLKKNTISFRKEMFLYEDLEFSLQCMGETNKIRMVQDVIYHYRQTEDEGNAGRRLSRIARISELIGMIEEAFQQILLRQGNSCLSEVNQILLELFLILCEQKIQTASSAKVRMICEDFSEWYSTRKMPVPDRYQNFFDRLMKHQVILLILHRAYIHLRHQIAVTIKSLRKKTSERRRVS